MRKEPHVGPMDDYPSSSQPTSKSGAPAEGAHEAWRGLWSRGSSWATFFVVVAALLVAAERFMISSWWRWADAFILLAGILLAIKFWTWEEAREEPKAAVRISACVVLSLVALATVIANHSMNAPPGPQAPEKLLFKQAVKDTFACNGLTHQFFAHFNGDAQRTQNMPSPADNSSAQDTTHEYEAQSRETVARYQKDYAAEFQDVRRQLLLGGVNDNDDLAERRFRDPWNIVEVVDVCRDLGYLSRQYANQLRDRGVINSSEFDEIEIK